MAEDYSPKDFDVVIFDDENSPWRRREAHKRRVEKLTAGYSKLILYFY